MRALITGAGGFAGNHLLRHLLATQPETDIIGTIYHGDRQRELPGDVQAYPIDLLDEKAVEAMLSSLAPDVIYHLAAQASPSKALKSVWPTLETNMRSQLNIIEGCLAIGLHPRMLITTSGEIYRTPTSGNMSLDERCELYPSSPYALSKIAQDLMGWQYFLSHDFPIIRARPFNHTGPGQAPYFVAPDFAIQIAEIEVDLRAPIMFVGNLAAKRDFTDVRDVVKAYALLMASGIPGEAYNIASNHSYSIQLILETLLEFSNTRIEVQIDSDKLRPVDVPIKQGDYTKLNKLTGWEPHIPLRQSLEDLLEDCRQRVKESRRSN